MELWNALHWYLLLAGGGLDVRGFSVPWGCALEECPLSELRNLSLLFFRTPGGQNISVWRRFTELALKGCGNCGTTAQLSLIYQAQWLSATLRDKFSKPPPGARAAMRRLSYDLKRLRRASKRLIYAGSPPPASLSPRVDASKEAVNIMMVIGADYAQHALPTLQSLLLHRTSPVDIHIVTDAEGFAAALRVISAMPPSLLVHTSFHSVALGLDDPKSSLSRAIRRVNCPAWEHASEDPGKTYRGHDVVLGKIPWFAHAFPHEVMPDHVERAIYVDSGDVLVFGDIYELWRAFDLFGPTQMIGMANVSFFETTARLNGGVGMYHLARMRARGFTATVQAVECPLGSSVSNNGLAAVQKVVEQSKEIWFELPEWWCYVPNFHDFGQRYVDFPGLVNPYRLLHPCPATVEVYASYLADVDTFLLLAPARAKRLPAVTVDQRCSRFLHELWRLEDKQRYLRADPACGKPIAAMHCLSTYKFFPWAQQLFEFWGARPPSSYYASSGKIIFGVNVSELE